MTENEKMVKKFKDAISDILYDNQEPIEDYWNIEFNAIKEEHFEKVTDAIYEAIVKSSSVSITDPVPAYKNWDHS